MSLQDIDLDDPLMKLLLDGSDNSNARFLASHACEEDGFDSCFIYGWVIFNVL